MIVKIKSLEDALAALEGRLGKVTELGYIASKVQSSAPKNLVDQCQAFLLHETTVRPAGVASGTRNISKSTSGRCENYRMRFIDIDNPICRPILPFKSTSTSS